MGVGVRGIVDGVGVSEILIGQVARREIVSSVIGVDELIHRAETARTNGEGDGIRVTLLKMGISLFQLYGEEANLL